MDINSLIFKFVFPASKGAPARAYSLRVVMKRLDQHREALYVGAPLVCPNIILSAGNSSLTAFGFTA